MILNLITIGDMILLTPMDIHNKEFKRSFRGYNEDEIDEFLDQVVNDYEKLFRENDRLKEDLARAQKDNEQYQQLEQNLKDTLLVAQKTAEEVTSNARKNAEETRENTAKECANKVQEAEMQAGSLVRQFGGSKVLIHYGEGSVVRSGLLDRVKQSLTDARTER